MRKLGGGTIASMMRSSKIKTAKIGHTRVRGGMRTGFSLGKMRRMALHPSNEPFSLSSILTFRRKGKI